VAGSDSGEQWDLARPSKKILTYEIVSIREQDLTRSTCERGVRNVHAYLDAVVDGA
jgi:hypothetical protein